MTKIGTTMKLLQVAFLGCAAAALMNSAALAGGEDAVGLKDMPAPVSTPKEDRKISVSAGATTDYVFRGVSQNVNDPSVNAALTISYKMFYIGVSAEAVSPDVTCNGCAMEADVIGGFKPSFNGWDFDFGFIYYGYPNQIDNGNPAVDFFELKASVSRALFPKVLTLTGTVFWSPDYTNESGSTWTVEGTVALTPPCCGGFTISGTVGYLDTEDDELNFSVYSGIGTPHYSYWNVGVFKTFLEHYTFDVRYWGTDIPTTAPARFVAGDRIVGTFTFSY